jgi:hypothetical protein
MQLTDLSVQFSDFDYDPQAFAATRHHAFSYKGTHTITADCNDCSDGYESEGHDESSRRSVAAWIKKHEAGE